MLKQSMSWWWVEESKVSRPCTGQRCQLTKQVSQLTSRESLSKVFPVLFHQNTIITAFEETLMSLRLNLAWPSNVKVGLN